MLRRAALLLTPLALLAATASGARTAITATQTKRKAEVNVLEYVVKTARGRQLPGLVNPRTHLLVNNTEAICHGRGRQFAGDRFARFACVVRPHLHRRREGLFVRYRALPHGQFAIRRLRFVRR